MALGSATHLWILGAPSTEILRSWVLEAVGAGILRASALFLLTTACGKKSVGEDCTVAAGDCADGTRCILYGARDIVNGSPACTTKTLCSVTCGTDADCVTRLGAGHICQKDCAEGSCLKGQ
jgi:hypothetical protein